jgi:DHA1 family multidrug resistance protein-like MFS transporter
VVIYLALAYPQYAASLFAGNALAKSILACGAVLWSGPLFENLGVGRGVSLLGGLMFGCVVGIFVLYFFGKGLRVRSRFAISS